MNYIINPESGMSDFFYCERQTQPYFAPHVHSHMEFVYVLQGSVNITISQKNYVLTKNQMAIVMPYEVHGYDSGPDSAAFILACPPEYISEYRSLLSGRFFEPACTEMDKLHLEIIDSIIDGGFQDDLQKKALIYCTVSGFLKTCRQNEGPPFEYDLYRKVIVYISENYSENISLKTAALYAGVTVAHLSRVLNGEGKAGFSQILNSLRVYSAKKLLAEDRLTVSEIAMNSGFGSIRNFNRIFRQQFGCSPGEWRKACKGTAAKARQEE